MLAVLSIHMADTSPKFGALVVASLAGVVGTKYLLGGALALIDETVNSSMLVADSTVLTIGCGVVLAVAAGGFIEGAVWARTSTLLAFLLVAGLSVPAVLAFDPIITAETVGVGLSIVYLLRRNPIDRADEATVDETDSASRVGSTLR